MDWDRLNLKGKEDKYIPVLLEIVSKYFSSYFLNIDVHAVQKLKHIRPLY